MKPNEQDRQYRSNLVGTGSVRMGVAEGAEAHIVSILTDMYADPELACVREYATNAYDSHKEAGQERPIEVSLPTPYEPTLVVRDYGIGLDAEGIRELYSQYGASTKRETNDAQGMLGIGCKSALAYTDQFTVVGFKNGVRTQVVISRDEDGAATQHIVDVSHGEYENGVEVTIPAKRDNEMPDKARDFFRFWPKGSVLVDGEEPKPVGTYEGDDENGDTYRNIWLDDRTLLTNEVGEDLIVMGYVAYPLVDGDDALFKAPQGSRYYDPRRGYVYSKAFSAVCFVDIGEVNFAPSRESLRTTKRTKDKLDQLRQHIASTFDASIRAQIAGAKDAKEAQDLLTRGISLGFDAKSNPAQWRGRDVLLKLERGKKVQTTTTPPQTTLSTSGVDDWASDECLRYSYLHTNFTAYRARRQGERDGVVSLTQGELSIFVGFDTKWLTPVKREKLALWERQKGVKLSATVFVDKLSKTEKFWTSGWPIYDWAEVEAMVLPKTTTADGPAVRLKGSYDCIVKGQVESGVAASRIDTTKPVYYAHGNAWTVRQHQVLRAGALPTDSTVVCLPRNRIEKFVRDFPMAVELSDAARAAAKEWESKIDRDQVKAWAVQRSDAHLILKALKGKAFDDPTLNTLIRLADTNCERYAKGLETYSAWVESPDRSAVQTLIVNTISRYPLADWRSFSQPSGKNLEHLVLYLKAAIAAERTV